MTSCNRVCHVWFTKGERPPGLADKRFTFAYVFAAAEPGTDNAFALVLPELSTEMMQIYLEEFAKTIAPDEHVAMVMDRGTRAPSRSRRSNDWNLANL